MVCAAAARRMPPTHPPVCPAPKGARAARLSWCGPSGPSLPPARPPVCSAPVGAGSSRGPSPVGGWVVCAAAARWMPPSRPPVCPALMGAGSPCHLVRSVTRPPVCSAPVGAGSPHPPVMWSVTRPPAPQSAGSPPSLGCLCTHPPTRSPRAAVSARRRPPPRAPPSAFRRRPVVVGRSYRAGRCGVNGWVGGRHPPRSGGVGTRPRAAGKRQGGETVGVPEERGPGRPGEPTRPAPLAVAVTLESWQSSMYPKSSSPSPRPWSRSRPSWTSTR